MSKRDKVLLLLIVVLVLGGGTYYFGHMRMSDQIEALEFRRSNLEQSIEQIEARLYERDRIETQIEEITREKFRIVNSYTRTLDQEEYLIHVRNIMNESNVELGVIRHITDGRLELDDADLAPVPVPDETDIDADEQFDGEGEGIPPSNDLEAETVVAETDEVVALFSTYSFEFQATYAQLIQFLTLLYGSGGSFICVDLSIDRARDGGLLSIVMNLEFHTFMNLDEYTRSVDYGSILETERNTNRETIFLP